MLPTSLKKEKGKEATDLLKEVELPAEEGWFKVGVGKAERSFQFKMLAKKYRLPIQDLPKRGFKSSRSLNLTLKVFSNKLSFPRLGVIISKKTAKAAVKRNELRRVTFNFVKAFFTELTPADYLLIINKELKKEELQKELKNLFNV